MEALRVAGLLRLPAADPPGLLDLSSNDYLGYARQPLELTGEGGAGASRLVSGTRPAHEEAESDLAAWVGQPRALLFSSGYAANVGALSALAGPGDVVVSDALNHASIVDGCRLCGATVLVTPHTDAGAMRAALHRARGARRRWLVTESYFSMDGDASDLGRLREICDEAGAGLVVDEAHALGVFGPRGAGRCALAGVRADVVVGGLGKAVGLQGAFVAGSEEVVTWLWNRARSFVFSTGSSPALARAVVERLAEVAADEVGRARLGVVAGRLRSRLGELGARVGAGSLGPIIPWIIGGEAEALAVAERGRAEGLLLRAIRPPTVAVGSARVRLTAGSRLSEAELARVQEALGRVAGVSRETPAAR